MKRFLLVLLTLIPLLASAKPATELTGRYVLQGARETGSTLVLKDDGRFEATFAYGNLDGHIQGHWQRTKDTVTLTAEGHSDVPELFKDVPPDRWRGLPDSGSQRLLHGAVIPGVIL